MNSKRTALYTFGIFRAPADDAVNQGFHDRNDRNLLAVELSEGFIARSNYDDEPGRETWASRFFPASMLNVEMVGRHRHCLYGKIWLHLWHSLTVAFMPRH
jgi:hypothetical protein